MVRILGVLPVPNLAKAIAAASGTSTASGGLDVFSTYLYEGNGSTQTITNGIDLAGEGGMVWIKDRENANDNLIHDTERGPLDRLVTSATYAEATNPAGKDVTAFNSDGFTLGENYNGTNYSGFNYVSWTFRKAPRFFDVVTYTGDGTSNRNIAHDLGVAPGMIVVKKTSASGTSWMTWHRSKSGSYLLLNTTGAAVASQQYVFGDDSVAIDPTDSVFTLASDGSVNANGAEYVAYLYAHDPLGPSGDGSDGLIACGSYTGAGADLDIDLGWEPQYAMIKCTSAAATNWVVFDNMRGFLASGDSKDLRPNVSTPEGYNSAIRVNSQGFTAVNGIDGQVNASGRDYIYMAIRRPMAVPESGDEVFAIDTMTATDPDFDGTGFPVDFALMRDIDSTYDTYARSRLTGTAHLLTNTTAAEGSNAGTTFDFMDGWGSYDYGVLTDMYSWMFKRAPQFFDVVCYEGDGVAGLTVKHNLGVAPEMMWIKDRDHGSKHWMVYHKDLNIATHLFLNGTHVPQTDNAWYGTVPTATQFQVGSYSSINTSAESFIAYLFATLAGISKVGSYTGNGSNQTIDCGFSAGARFILIKRTDSTGDWFMWDSERGIVAGNDPRLSLNTTAAEVTSDDSVDPDNSGFIVNQVSATNINVTSAEYIFLAIA